MKSIAWLFAFPFVVACSSSSSPGAAPLADAGAESHDADTAKDSAAADIDAGDDASVEVDASIGTTYLRLVNLSPDAPAIDICVAKGGNSTWTGPLLATTAGLPYAHATAYLPLAPDEYDVRMVAAGSTDCTTSIGPFSNSLSTLRDGVYTTVALEGDAQVSGSDAPAAVHAYQDDATTPAGAIAVRFVNASSSLNTVDFGTGSLATSSFAPMFVHTLIGYAALSTAGDAGALDGNAYLSVAPMNAATMSVHSTGDATDAVTATSITAAAGSTVTFFLIGGKTGDATNPTALLLCDDNAPAKNGFASCAVVSP